MEKNKRRWFVVTGAAAAGVGGLIAVAGTAAADAPRLNDQQPPASVQLVDQSRVSAGDDATQQTQDTANTVNTANTANTPNTPNTPDSASSPG